MITNRHILEYINAEPFEPFRLKMASGASFEIRHPEMIQVGRTTATVSVWTNSDEGQIRERRQEISILLVESIEMVAGGNQQHA